MNIPFERWIREQTLSSRSIELIEEALICYRAKAYKASLLYSYLSFQNIVKERLLNSSNPPGYAEHFWIQIQQDLRSDDKWESKLIECIERIQPGNIFNLSNDIKQQYFYWKDRRNDCAHAKGNKIGISHVETFWLFFESNLSKFVVNGGKESLIQRIMTYFDPVQTPRNHDPSLIINDIPKAIDTNEYIEILDVLYSTTDDGPFLNESTFPFWNQLFNLNDAFIEKLIDFIKQKTKLCLVLLTEDPSKVTYFANDTTFIRTLWKGMIRNSYQHYKIILGLLRHRLIPEDQFSEFVETVTTKVNDTLFIRAEDVDLMILEESGFFNELRNLAFVEKKINNFDWARENKHLITHLIVRCGFDEATVRTINSTFSSAFIPWRLRDALNEMFEANPRLKVEYRAINEQIGGELPEYFFSDEED
ncbi:hypothetical protein [Paenibacillus polymyxa]|uniref:hypothetical protein n=1 Tax=Paenibacillus polymyxa TaxID=1406 RepID=UPI00046E9CEA|nr:hypothetical protein [Paenibacillus polymyxa]